MSLKTKPPGKPAAKDDDAAFERAISKAPDQKVRGKPGRKAGAAYGIGLAAGEGRRQLTVTFALQLILRLNRRAERTGIPRATIIIMALERLFASDDPLLGKSGDEDGEDS